jgi:phage N-6-adenine-methyltransferase
MSSTLSRPAYMKTMTSSSSDEWPTPQWLVDVLAAEFGPFCLDPAATAENAKAPLFFTKDDDGLSQPWKGRVWLNPPYGTALTPWMTKARDEVARGNADVVVCLVPARVNARWWLRAYEEATLTRFIPGRLANPGGGQWPFPSCIMVFGSDDRRHGLKAFRCPVCTQWFWPARSDFIACSRKCRRALQRDRLSSVSWSG